MLSIYYFAYGSNLNKKQMLERCPESKPRFTATLNHYKLIFVGWSRQWHGGTASIRPVRGDKVSGVVYELTQKDLQRLDKYEGYPQTYERINVKVNNEFGEMVEAVTYVYKGNIEEAPPSKEYLAIMQQSYREWGIE